MKLYPYIEGATDGLPRITREQHHYIEQMVAEPTGGVLNATDMGGGKTVMAVEHLLRVGAKRALVIGVKDTFGQWAEQFAEQSDGAVKLRRIDSTKAGKQNLAAMLAGEEGIFFGGSQFLTRQDWEYVGRVDVYGEPVMKLDKEGEPTDKQETDRVHKGIYRRMAPLEMIILDECHIVAANRKNVALSTLKTMRTEWKVALSGTPYGNKFENMWSIARWVWGDLIDGSFHRWKNEWCEVSTEEIYVGGKKREIEKIEGEKVPGEFVKTLPCYVRIEAPVGPLPPATVVEVSLTDAQRAQYAQMEQDAIAWLREHGRTGSDADLAPLVAEVAISQRQRLRTATLGEMSFNDGGEVDFNLDCKSTKLNALAGVLRVWGDEKVVIYTDSKKFAKVAAERMNRAGLRTEAWHGDIPSARRDEIKASFLKPVAEGGIQYIVAVIAAFGTGLDGFQRVCSKIIWLSETEDGIQGEQAARRIWRRGVDKDSFQHVKLIARDTLDQGIFMGLQVKAELMSETLKAA